MNSKDIRNRINKRINAKYDERQKILSKIKNALSIEFNKISIYREEIIIDKKNIKDYEDASILQASKGTKKVNTENGIGFGNDDNKVPFFKVELPESIIGSSRFYYKGIEVDYLPIGDLKSLENDLEFILKEIEREVDKFLI
ncbi:MAG: hypothetical protein M3162_07565 [Thermoproteota archaeon]|nr:hypothetical protein [Thermoproteota archaeon]